MLIHKITTAYIYIQGLLDRLSVHMHVVDHNISQALNFYYKKL